MLNRWLLKMFINFSKPVWRENAVVVAANLTVISCGMSIVWSSPMLVKLQDENQTILPKPLTQQEAAWVVSTGMLVCLAAIPINSFTIDTFGRKWSFVLCLLPRAIQIVLLIFASRFWMVLVGRAIGTFTDMWIILILPSYVAEVAGKNTRGASGTMMQIMSTLGMLIMFGIGPFVPYLTMNLIMTAIDIAVFIPIFFIPESPYFLYLKGRTTEAVEVLTYLRGSKDLAYEEIKQYSVNVTNEGDENDKSTFDTISKWELLRDRTVQKTIAMLVYLAIANQFLGYNSVLLYLQSIFMLAKTSVSTEISSLIIGFIQLLACLVTFVTTDRFGRKPILCISLAAMGVGMIGLAVYFLIMDQKSEIIGFLNYLPLISVAIVIYSYNAGMGSLSWIIVAELLCGPLRSYGIAAQGIFTMVLNFIITIFFPSVMASSTSTAFWVFAGFCIATCLFIGFLIPETKGKSFVEIQMALRSDKKGQNSSIKGEIY